MADGERERSIFITLLTTLLIGDESGGAPFGLGRSGGWVGCGEGGSRRERSEPMMRRKGWERAVLE